MVGQLHDNNLAGVSNSLQETVLHVHAEMLPGVARPSLLLRLELNHSVRASASRFPAPIPAHECSEAQGSLAHCSVSAAWPDLQAASPPVMSSLFLKRKRMSSWYRADSLFFKRWASSTIM